MPKYRMKVKANIFLNVEAESPEAAVAYMNGVLEDASISQPFGEAFRVGTHEAMFFYSGDDVEVASTMLDMADLSKRLVPSPGEILRMATEEYDDDPDPSGQIADAAPEDEDVHGAAGRTSCPIGPAGALGPPGEPEPAP
jgi:hypothetical protein